jgi:hypothetical protein
MSSVGAKYPGIHVSRDRAKKKRTKENRHRQCAFVTPARKVCASAGAELRESRGGVIMPLGYCDIKVSA